MRPPIDDAKQRSIRQVLIAVMLADDEIDPDELAAIRIVHRELIGRDLAEADLLAEVDRLRRIGMTVEQCLDEVSHDLELPTKQEIVRAAFAVAAADGFVLDEEDALLHRIGQALGLSNDEFRDALSPG